MTTDNSNGATREGVAKGLIFLANKTWRMAFIFIFIYW